jgi:excisionase family DNA binding protein
MKAVDREWLSPDELADWLGIPTNTIYQWRLRGLGPRGHKIGRHVRYRRADVEAWLAEQVDPR